MTLCKYFKETAQLLLLDSLFVVCMMLLSYYASMLA